MTDGRMRDLMLVLIQIVGRAAMPEAKVIEILGDGAKQRRAFNLADGTQTQQDIARKARIDTGNFSRTASRWIENGIAFWIGEGNDKRLVHIYAVPDTRARRRTPRGSRRKGHGP